MKIVSLAENTRINDTVGAEHGLSLYIETKTQKILFDMGQTDLFAANAETLGIDLSQVTVAVLSHGHYDHGGGLATFLQINKTAPVYLSRYAFGAYYNGTQKYIGLDSSLQQSDRLVYNSDERTIGEGLTLHHCNGRKKSFSLGSFGLNKKDGDGFTEDDFLHEQYLLIEEDGKKVLISGCSHKGILNIAEWFAPDVLVGGFHFSKLPTDSTLASYASFLDRFDTDYYTCHCTGEEQYLFMKNHMSRLHYLSAGQSIHL